MFRQFKEKNKNWLRLKLKPAIKCNKILCLSSRNMIDKTMCEVVWRNISDFYVNLRVEVGKHTQVILAMYFLSWKPQLQLVNLHRNRRYFVIKLHTWFCLSYFLKTNKIFYCIYQYFMGTVGVCLNTQTRIISVFWHKYYCSITSN
jgi:hypothetical protein